MARRMQRMLRLVAALLVGMAGDLANGQPAWNEGYPKLLFGSQMLSSDELFPAALGARPPEGGVPHELLIHLSVDSAMDDPSFTFNMPGFFGGDNRWMDDSGHLSCYTLENGVLTPSATCFPEEAEAGKWESTSRTLMLNLRDMEANVEYIVALSALSFGGGKGPLPPPCLEQDATMMISEAMEAGAATPQLATSFGSVSPIGCFSDRGGANPLGVTGNAFVTASIGQDASRNSYSTHQTLTVTIASNLDLSSIQGSIKSTISITGLVNSQTDDTDALAIAGKLGQGLSPLEVFLDEASWVKSTGTLTLTVADGATLPARVPVVFSFSLKLPASPSAAPTVLIEAMTGTSVVIASSPMLAADGGSAPLMTEGRALAVAGVGQKVSGIGQANTLFITLAPNFDLQSTAATAATITISGLVGFTNPDSSAQNPVVITPTSVESVADVFAIGQAVDRAEWHRDSGRLLLRVREGQRLAAGKSYSMRVTGFVNPFAAQASPDIHIEVSGDSSVARSPMAKAEGHAAPLFVTGPTFLVAQVGQSSTTVGARNTLTVTIQSNVGIETVAASQLTGTVSISGLVGFKDDDGDYPLANGGFSDLSGIVQGGVARWEKSTGTLAVTVAAGQRLEAGETYAFHVVLTNPNNAQPSPPISIEVTGTDAVQIPRMPVTRGDGAAAPLLVLEAGLAVARIGQAGSGAAMPNTLTVTLQPNLRLAVDTRIALQGLVNTATQDTNALPIAGCQGAFKSPATLGVNQGTWDAAAGTLEVLVAAEMEGGVPVVCSFGVTNPSAEQAAPAVFVTVSTQGTTLINRLRMRNALADRAPLFVSSNKFVTAAIGQSAPYPSMRGNIITATLAFNVALATAGAVESAITIRGLTGSATGSTSQLAISGDDFVAAAGTEVGAWDRAAGSLTVSVAASRSLAFNVPFVFSFQLDNPSAGQPAPEVTVSASGGQVISDTRMGPEGMACIHQQGDVAPLFIYAPGFLNRDISSSVTAQGARTRITVTLLSSVALASIAGSQTVVTIAGLTGYADPDSSSLAVTSSTGSLGPTASWARESGTVTIPINIGTVLEPGTRTAIIQFTLTNGPDPATPAPQISIGGLTGASGAAAMHFETRYPGPTIHFSAKTSHMASSLDVSFSAVQPISKGDTIVLILPSVSRLPSATGGSLWGVSSRPPAFSMHASEEEHRDALASGEDVASATFRRGYSGKAAETSSVFDGEEGTTLRLDMGDASVFGAVNVYAGMAMQIEGSEGRHVIYHQEPGAASKPAIVRFHPKFTFGTGHPSHVPVHSGYEILSQIDFVANSDICAGVRVNISIPASAGLLVPAVGVPDATIAHVRAGTASSLAIGSLSDMDSAEVQYSGTRGRLVAASLADLPSGTSYLGSPFVPTVLPSPYFPWIDGHRLLLTFDPDTQSHHMLTGYGPVRKTAMLAQGAMPVRRGRDRDTTAGGTAGLRSVRAGSLKETQSLTEQGGATHVWLRFDRNSLAGMLPRPVRGSVLQVKTEQMRFTGEVADSLEAVSGALLKNCRINGALCETADECFTAPPPAGATCLVMPTVTIEMAGGNSQGIRVTNPGVCTAEDKQTWPTKWTPVAAAGVVCDRVDVCDAADEVPGAECDVAFDGDFPVLRMERAMFGSAPTSLACTAAAPCEDAVTPSMAHVAQGGLVALQYTQSPSELDLANQQHLRLGYESTVLAVASGDHVVSLSPPQVVGSNCQQGNSLCNGQGCADITFTGCTLNPVATVTFTGGAVTAIEVDDSLVVGATTPGWMNGDGLKAWGNSLCKSDDRLVGTITLRADVSCAQGGAPSCGSTGCQPTLDNSKDALVFRYADAPAGGFAVDGDVVRVHPAQAGISFQVGLVPGTRLMRRDTELSADGVVSSPAAGIEYTWTDPVTGEVMSRLTPSVGIANLRLRFARGADGAALVYNETCRTACNQTGEGGFLIGSRRVVLAFDVLPGFTNASINLSLPTTFNNKGVLPSGRRLLAAPPGHEFRINADCGCPANLVSQDTVCTLSDPGEYQALLVPMSRCAAQPVTVTNTTPPPTSSPIPFLQPLPDDGASSYNPWIVVGGVLGGLAVTILCMIGGALWMRKKRRAQAPLGNEPAAPSAVHKYTEPDEKADEDEDQPEEQEAADVQKEEDEEDKSDGTSEPAELTEEGPVYVGRPVPLTPELMMSMSPGAGLGPDGTFFGGGTLGGNGSGANWSYTGSVHRDAPSQLGSLSTPYAPSLAPPRGYRPYQVAGPPASHTYPAQQAGGDFDNRFPTSPVVISSPVLAAASNASPSPGFTGNRRAVDLRLAVHDQDRSRTPPQRVPYGV